MRYDGSSKCRTGRAIFLLVWAFPGGHLLTAPPALAQGGTEQPAGLFERQCYSCHNIGGGDKKGPDLIGVTQRRDREWLHRFILSPKSLKNAGDAAAVQLFQQYAPEEMPDQMLSADQIDQILSLIEQHSAENKHFVPQSGQLARPVTPEDIPVGYQLFTGQRRLQNGGPACISCHSVEGMSWLGGGALGLDLTQVNERYTDVELAGILKAPAFPTMSKLFTGHELTDEEVVQLFAYLQSARGRVPNVARSTANLLACSTAGVLGLLGLLSFIWRGRLRGVRKPLLRMSRR